MKLISLILTCALAVAFLATPMHAMVSRSDAAVPRQFEQASTVFQGKVIAAESFVADEGNIQTRFSIRVDQPYKGQMPGVVTVTLPGGAIGNIADTVGCQPDLAVGQNRLFFLSKTGDGALVPTAGCASAAKVGAHNFRAALNEVALLSASSFEPTLVVNQGDASAQADGDGDIIAEATSSSATNLLTGGGLGARFLQPDRGETIPYLVDDEALPAGISLSAALGAVSNALSAWEDVSSLRFSYAGLQQFGEAASTVSAEDGVLRIQLHDLYGAITGTSTLGIGGRVHWTTVLSSDWTTGGQVFGNDFHETTRGYVVLKHTQSPMQTLSTFEEVLCHEIGHALSMAHSSENPGEPTSSAAYQAIMFFQAHQDGRGAQPSPWDTNVLQQIHPIANTPPYMFARVMDVVTANPQPAVSGINEITIGGYDLQGTVTSSALVEATSGYGTFAPSGNLLQYTPTVVGTGPRSDPAGLSYFDSVYARCSDGVHASPFVWLRVISLSQDNYPATSDGIPDNWMIANAWNANPAVGANHGSTDDADGDTIANIDEFRSWMDPDSPSSAQLVNAAPDGTVSWQGKAYELYELQGSTNLTDWFFVKAVLPTTDNPSVQVDVSTYDSVVYRAFKVP